MPGTDPGPADPFKFNISYEVVSLMQECIHALADHLESSQIGMGSRKEVRKWIGKWMAGK